MFTGIVQEVGRIAQIDRRGGGVSLMIHAPKTSRSVSVGDSVSTQGVCLTCTGLQRDTFAVDVSAETLRRTTLGALAAGHGLNLELAMRLSDRLGGHLVTGHVDGTGRLESSRPEGSGRMLTFSAPEHIMRYVVAKGSIAVDGVSLTVAAMLATGFQVALIPHTLKVTTLGQLGPGKPINLEADLIGKYVERLLHVDDKPGVHTGASRQSLASSGFIDSRVGDSEGNQ